MRQSVKPKAKNQEWLHNFKAVQLLNEAMLSVNWPTNCIGQQRLQLLSDAETTKFVSVTRSFPNFLGGAWGCMRLAFYMLYTNMIAQGYYIKALLGWSCSCPIRFIIN